MFSRLSYSTLLIAFSNAQVTLYSNWCHSNQGWKFCVYNYNLVINSILFQLFLRSQNQLMFCYLWHLVNLSFLLMPQSITNFNWFHHYIYFLGFGLTSVNVTIAVFSVNFAFYTICWDKHSLATPVLGSEPSINMCHTWPYPYHINCQALYTNYINLSTSKAFANMKCNHMCDSSILQTLHFVFRFCNDLIVNLYDLEFWRKTQFLAFIKLAVNK